MELQKTLRNGIIATRMIRVTPGNSFRSHPGSLHASVLPDGFTGVPRAGRIEPARVRGEERRHDKLVQTNESDQKSTHSDGSENVPELAAESCDVIADRLKLQPADTRLRLRFEC